MFHDPTARRHVPAPARARRDAHREGTRLNAPTANAGTQNDVEADDIELLDTADLPGGGELYLVRYGREFAIRFGREDLMASDLNGSEKALATLTFQRLGERAGRVLIGGLGMGFTLGAALAALPSNAEIVVAELIPKVVAWAQGPLAHLFGDNLADPRVSIQLRDVHDVIVAAPGGFDAILLDVDNGPDGLIHLANDRLYCNWGLRAAFAALRPGGILAVWSAYRDDAFRDRLEKAGFAVDEMMVRATGGRTGARHTIWLASRPDTQPA